MYLDPVRVSANNSLNTIHTPLIKNRLGQVLLLYNRIPVVTPRRGIPVCLRFTLGF
ncbi:hypothetical protein M378DRAFT_596410 [Amanita muscaria Koide BX008]|uniref:Uncharacterized protein n=1 Tax=Amanita muscaria (strain Koide BX008) TaxID=946122 RepID=A0A0C2X6M6_AMAMK|nr:hypothetical protein M378DRAFT_596410 [Amanita muscaria Koide BX008]